MPRIEQTSCSLTSLYQDWLSLSSFPKVPYCLPPSYRKCMLMCPSHGTLTPGKQWYYQH